MPRTSTPDSRRRAVSSDSLSVADSATPWARLESLMVLHFLRVHHDQAEHHLDELLVELVLDAPLLHAVDEGLLALAVVDGDAQLFLDLGQLDHEPAPPRELLDDRVVHGVAALADAVQILREVLGHGDII